MKYYDINNFQKIFVIKKNSIFDPCIGIKRNRWAGGLPLLGSETLLSFLDLMFVNRSSRFFSYPLNSSMLQFVDSFTWTKVSTSDFRKNVFRNFLLNFWTEIRKHEIIFDFIIIRLFSEVIWPRRIKIG